MDARAINELVPERPCYNKHVAILKISSRVVSIAVKFIEQNRQTLPAILFKGGGRIATGIMRGILLCLYFRKVQKWLSTHIQSCTSWCTV